MIQCGAATAKFPRWKVILNTILHWDFQLVAEGHPEKKFSALKLKLRPWPFHTHTLPPTLTSEASSEEWTYSSQAPKAIPIYEDKVRNVTARETSSFLPCRHFMEVQPKMLGEQWIRKREGGTSKMKEVSSGTAWGIHVKTASIIKSDKPVLPGSCSPRKC